MSLKTFKAEILDINELRTYYADTVDDAARLAEEEFGEDNVGRVLPVVDHDKVA